jgi:hypothetical protein
MSPEALEDYRARAAVAADPKYRTVVGQIEYDRLRAKGKDYLRRERLRKWAQDERQDLETLLRGAQATLELAAVLEVRDMARGMMRAAENRVAALETLERELW